MTDLPVDDGLIRRGQFRIELVQLLNWGSYQDIHRMPVAPETLHGEGLSPKFVDYMRQWKNFVAA